MFHHELEGESPFVKRLEISPFYSLHLSQYLRELLYREKSKIGKYFP